MEFAGKEEELLYNEGLKFFPELDARRVATGPGTNSMITKYFPQKGNFSGYETEKFKRLIALKKLIVIYSWIKDNIEVQKSSYSKATESIYLNIKGKRIRLSCHDPRDKENFKGTNMHIKWNSSIDKVQKLMTKYYGSN